MYGKQAAEVSKAFNDYFLYGGFPELTDVIAKRVWLNDIYSKIFFSDLIVRNKVRNEEALGLLVRRLAENVKQPVSYTRLANLISSIGIKISKATVIEFIRYLKRILPHIPYRELCRQICRAQFKHEALFYRQWLTEYLFA